GRHSRNLHPDRRTGRRPRGTPRRRAAPAACAARATRAGVRAPRVPTPARGARVRTRRRRCCPVRRPPRCAARPASAPAIHARPPAPRAPSARRHRRRAASRTLRRRAVRRCRRAACRGGRDRPASRGFYTCAVSDPASHPAPRAPDVADPATLALRIKTLAREAGFQRCGVAGVELGQDEAFLRDWLAQGLYGSMEWMARHGDKRSRPQELVPGTLRVISVGLDYGQDPDAAWRTLEDGERAYVARYALGRDYHKLMRNRLQKLAERVADEIGPFGHRVFVDSAPVLERALARNAGMGWIGKHTCLIDRDGGSWFFLGEIYVDLPLPIDPPASAHCGSCVRCIEVCPTGAITAPHRLDARRCIS